VTWLCSDAADGVTGQVLLVVGSRISVIGPLAVSARVDLADDWTAADLAAARATLFPGGGSNFPGGGSNFPGGGSNVVPVPPT